MKAQLLDLNGGMAEMSGPAGFLALSLSHNMPKVLRISNSQMVSHCTIYKYILKLFLWKKDVLSYTISLGASLGRAYT